MDFSVTRQKSTISSFSTIRNYFWGQRSNIPQIIGKLKEGCAISNIMLRVIGCKQSWHQFLINFSKIPDSKFLSYTTKMKNTFAKIQKKCQKMPFSQKNWPKSLIKVWKFGSTIHTYSKFEKSTIRNRIHYIKFILVLVIWKNPLIRVFPLFAIKLYRESTVLKKTFLVWIFSFHFTFESF